MTIEQMRLELLELGYPVEDFSDQKVKRIYPKATVPKEYIFEDLIRRDFPINEIAEWRLMWIYRYSLIEGWSIHQKAMDGGLWDDKYPHRKNGDAICQDESFY